MSVDLRCGNISVPKHLLYGTKVGATLEKVSCEGMSESVWRHPLRDAYLIDVFTENLPRAHAGEWLPLRIQEKDSFPLSTLDFRPQFARVYRNGADGLPTDWHDALLAAFAKNTHESLIHQHVANTNSDPFRHSETRAIGELEHCPVTKCERLVKRRCRDQPLHLVD